MHSSRPGCYPPTCLGGSIQPSVSAYPFETEGKREAVPSIAEKICSPLKLPWSESIPFVSAAFQFAYAPVTKAVLGKCSDDTKFHTWGISVDCDKHAGLE